MKRNTVTVIIGLLVIAGGIFYAGNVMGYWDTNFSFDGWWTLFIILPCVLSMCTSGINLLNCIGVGVGILLLLSAQGVFPNNLGYKLIAPLVIVLLGLSLIFKKPMKFNKEGNNGIFASSHGDKHFAVFGGNTPRLDGVIFRGASAYAVFGGIDLKLSKSIIKRDCAINAYSIFGNTDIILPDNVRVVVSSMPIIGSLQNTFKSEVQDNAPTVYIRAISVFGSTEIH